MERIEVRPIFIRPKQIKEVIGLSEASVWRLEKAGKFPKRRKVGPGCVGWLYSELEEFIQRS